MWSVAVLDQGISNWFERTRKPNVYEYDIYDGNQETDYGVEKTHGTYVALTASAVQPALGFIDLRIMNPDGLLYTSDADLALNRVIRLSDQGYQIGAVNLSWGGFSYPYQITGELATLRARGIFAVAASGNSGSAGALELPLYPALLSDVIAVGSHDGAGNPSPWSQNHPGYITVLADGEDMPEPGANGTSFAAPQVSATVASLQAYAWAAIGRPLTLPEMRDALQQGGRAPLSNPDPADRSTRYYLYDHGGVVNYFVTRYLNGVFDPLSYVASYADLMDACGANGPAGLAHFLAAGAFEGRTASFDGWSYLAANPDVLALGSSVAAAAGHYILYGRFERRGTRFDAWSYEAANPDLLAAFGSNTSAAARHYVELGRREGRGTRFDAYRYLATYGDLLEAWGGDTTRAAEHYVRFGYREGRRPLFDGAAYLAANADLAAALGGDTALAARHYVEYGWREGRLTAPEPPAVSEGAVDLPASTATGGRVSVGGAVTGTLAPASSSLYSSTDTDWYAVTLRAGQTVRFSVAVRPTSLYAVSDLGLTLRNGSGVTIATAAAPTRLWGTDATLSYAVKTTGTYYVAVGGTIGRDTWTAPLKPQPYTLSAATDGARGVELALAAP